MTNIDFDKYHVTELSQCEKNNTNGGSIILLGAVIFIGGCAILGFIKGYTDNLSEGK